MGSRHTYRSYVRSCLILVCLLSITGCSLAKLKSGLITGAATTAVVGVTSVLPGGAIVPSVLGGVTAATASALSAEDQTKGEPISVTADTVVNKAPDNFWTLLGKLASTGGWLLILVFIVPMVLGWILPGPLERKKKKK
jgi:hypothetical protein